jgi:hypothetical protein
MDDLSRPLKAFHDFLIADLRKISVELTDPEK